LQPVQVCKPTTKVHCLEVQNLTKESVRLHGQQAAGPGQPLPKVGCATIAAQTHATFQVPAGSAWAAVGVKTGHVYVTDFEALNPTSQLIVQPVGPSPGPPPARQSCSKFPFLGVIIGWAVAGLLLIGLVYAKTPKALTATQRVNLASATGGVQAFKAHLQLRSARRRTFTVVTVIGVLGLVLLLLAWCVAEGPCSSKPTCTECTSRGQAFYPAVTGSGWDKFLCRSLGRCPCVSPVLAGRCQLYAEQGHKNYTWDSAKAGQRYKQTFTDPTKTPYLCACCNDGADCVNVAESPAVSCTV